MVVMGSASVDKWVPFGRRNPPIDPNLLSNDELLAEIEERRRILTLRTRDGLTQQELDARREVFAEWVERAERRRGEARCPLVGGESRENRRAAPEPTFGLNHLSRSELTPGDIRKILIHYVGERISPGYATNVLRDRLNKLYPYTLSDIAKDSGWDCSICNDKYPVIRRRSTHGRSPAPRHPLLASCEHLRDIASGGTGELSNLRIAHLICNLSKEAAYSCLGGRKGLLALHTLVWERDKGPLVNPASWYGSVLEDGEEIEAQMIAAGFRLPSYKSWDDAATRAARPEALRLAREALREAKVSPKRPHMGTNDATGTSVRSS